MWPEGAASMGTEVRYQADLFHRDWMEDRPMGNILPGIIGKTERHQSGVIHVFIPNAFPPVNDLPRMFREFFLPRRYSDQYAGVLVGQSPGQLPT